MSTLGTDVLGEIPLGALTAEAPVVAGRVPITPIDPRFMTVEHWTSLSSAALLPFGFVQHSADESDWRVWAAKVRLVPEIAALQVADPQHSETWQQWAFAYNGRLWMR